MRQPGKPTRPRRRIRWAEMGWRDHLRVGAGVFFVMLGIAGVILPILQGVLFLVVAMLLLAPYSVFVQRQQARFEARFPGLSARARGVVERIRKCFGARG
ncbi:hypothetical protein HKX41_09100 [Salinisphaera sp. USBA-960]|nr:hypothetical protein [Salifodinibacter halophilus]